MTNQMLKELYIGREIFINEREESLIIRGITKDGDCLTIETWAGSSLRFSIEKNYFYTIYRNEVDRVSIGFNKKTHRSAYLQNKIKILKKENDLRSKANLEAWAQIRVYQSELMSL